MNVAVKLFGPQAQLIGRSELAVRLPDEAPTCTALRRALVEAAPALATSLPASRFAVNHEYVDDRHILAPEDEVALIGLISGG